MAMNMTGYVMGDILDGRFEEFFHIHPVFLWRKNDPYFQHFQFLIFENVWRLQFCQFCFIFLFCKEKVYLSPAKETKLAKVYNLQTFQAYA
jgi:hypothetical protein